MHSRRRHGYPEHQPARGYAGVPRFAGVQELSQPRIIVLDNASTTVRWRRFAAFIPRAGDRADRKPGLRRQ